MNVNKVIVVGRVVKKPEIKKLPTGQSICNLSIATNHVYTKDGEKKESTEFHEIIIFSKQAENTATYVDKGQEVAVTGRLQTRSWDKDGVKMYRTEIIADSIQFGSKAPTPKVGNTDVDYPVPDETNDPSSVPF